MYSREKKNNILLYSPQFAEGTLRSSTLNYMVFVKKKFVNTRLYTILHVGRYMGRVINIPARSFNRKYSTKTLLFRSKAITKEPNFCDRIITFDIRSLFADEIRFFSIIAVVGGALFL